MHVPFPAPSPADARLQSILRFIHASRGVTRSDVGRATNLNPSTVVRLVGELRELGLVVNEETLHRRRRGRPSDILRINPKAGYAVGLEFGRDHLIMAITDAVGEVVSWSNEADVPPFAASETTAHALIAAVEALVATAGIAWENVDAIGLALHDIVNARGEWVTKDRIHDAPFAIQDVFQRNLRRTTTVEDVSRAFAEAEFRYGAGRHRQDMAYVFIGSHGVGSGVFVNGQLLKSSSGVCGEIGHIIVDEGGPLCHCGSRGCLETLASHEAVMRQLEVLLAQGVRVSVPEAQLTFGQLCAAAGAGDKVASLVLHRLAHNVAIAVASMINLTGTPHIVVGGQLALAGDVFLSDLASAVRHRIIALLARDLTVSYARLPLNAGARGVAVQALQTQWLTGDILSRARARKQAA